MRTFVFICEIPDFLLQPIHGDTSTDAAASGGGNRRAGSSNRDPRYERLRRLLADHSSGVMLAMHLETKGYGLALYASEEEALAACKAAMTPEQTGMHFPPLKLRIVEKEKPAPPEAVYSPDITIDGAAVPKAGLAVTRGLDLAYRGRSIPRWCAATLEEKDCPFGANCHKIHSAEFQTTVRKRPRVDVEDITGSRLSEEEAHRVSLLLRDGRAAEAALVPPELRLSPEGDVYVPVTAAEVAALLASVDAHRDNKRRATESNTTATTPTTASATTAAAIDSLSARVQQALDGSPQGQQLKARPFFVRLSFPGGAPWDWSIQCDSTDTTSGGSNCGGGGGSSGGLATLRRLCPLPASGAPTPLDRDLVCQRAFYHMNRLNAFTDARRAVAAVAASPTVADGFAQFQRSSSSTTTGASEGVRGDAEGPGATATAATTATGAPPLYLVLRPWVCLPTVGHEASAFIERGGRRLRGIVQRYGQQRLMVPATADMFTLPPSSYSSTEVSDGNEEEENSSRAARVEAALGQFVIIGADRDEPQEAALEAQMRRHGRLFVKAVDTLRRHIAAAAATAAAPSSSSSSFPSLPAGAAWCAELAVVTYLPTSTVATTDASLVERVVVLSFKPYQQALEECALYTHLVVSTNNNPGAASNSGGGDAGVEVTWNTQKHAYVPLFSRAVLERLRPESS